MVDYRENMTPEDRKTLEMAEKSIQDMDALINKGLPSTNTVHNANITLT